MNSRNTVKTANNLFLVTVLISLCVNIFVSLLSVKGISLHIIANLLVSQIIILLPGLIYYVCITKDDAPFKIYKKIKPITVLLLIVFTWLILPLTTAANVFSQIFTKNEVMSISGNVLSLPLGVAVLIIGILGPFSEEFVFRGLIYNSLKNRTKRYIASGIISALYFGLMHMNFNQFCYAFLLGIIFAIINEVLDSTWPSFVCHAVVNTQNVLLLYGMNMVFTKYSGQSVAGYYDEMGNQALTNNKVIIVIMFVVLLIFSLVTTTLAALLLYGIAHIEGKADRIRLVFNKNILETKEKVVTISGYIAITVCIFVMFVLEPLTKIIKK